MHVSTVDTCIYLVRWLRALPSRAVEMQKREHSASTASVCSRWCHWWIRAHGRRLATASHARNTPGSPVDHLQAHGTASGRGCRDGRSGSRALDKSFQPLVTRTTQLLIERAGTPRARRRSEIRHGITINWLQLVSENPVTTSMLLLERQSC